MKKQDTTNTFNEGLIMDLNPLVTPNNVVTNCLNGTLITYNGNENVLLNDMGNGRVETAYLPEGYVPLGTAELGGIIYIVSYNPLTDKCLIGSFPSPERNITTDELGETKKTLKLMDFYSDKDKNFISSPYKKLILLDKELNPGDKFLISCELLNNDIKYISAKKEGNKNPDLYPKYLKLNVVAILDNGQIVNLNDTLVWNTDNNYYIIKDSVGLDGKVTLDEYRNLIQSNYNVFNSPVSGKLAILAELECISSFDVSWDAIKNKDNLWEFYFFLNWTYDNNLSRDKINLYSIKVECTGLDSSELILDDYPYSTGAGTTDILRKENVTFYTPYYIDKIIKDPDYKTNLGITLPRKNDGTDNQYFLKTPITLKKDASGIVYFTVYPGMPFGYLEYLKSTFLVDLDKLGTGEVELKEYRYYKDANSITLNWGLNAYPENNKLIEEVNFNFYKFGKLVNKWIQDQGNNIDNSRTITINDDTKWEGGGNTTSPESLLTRNSHYTVPKQSSYSGHFTETIKNLENNQLYLVEMEINYNNEKTYRYYRFLYTSNVFNDYYFKVTDFKEINLGEALNNYHPITHKADQINLTNSDNKIKLLNSKNEEKTTIPSYLGIDEELLLKYTIQDDYSCDINFGVSSATDNSTFAISLSNITEKAFKTEFTSNAQKLYIDSSNNSLDVSELQEIENTSKVTGEFDNDTFTGKFTLTLKTPMRIKYQTTSLIPIPYALSLFDVGLAWLLVDGGDKWIDLYVADEYIRSEAVGDNLKASFKDDSNTIGVLKKYTNVYNEIKEKLKSYDVLALCFRVHESARDGTQGSWSMWGKGTWGGRAASNRLYFASRDEKNPNNNGPILLLYAMLDTNDDIQLFTPAINYFKSNANSYIGTASWYDLLLVIRRDNNDEWSPINPKPFALAKSDMKEDNIKRPFEKYYKLIPNSTTKEVRPWNKIYYYNNYKWSTKFSIDCEGEISIEINNELLLGNLANYPANLSYETSLNFTVEGHIDESENFTQYLDMLLYGNSSSTLVLVGDVVNSYEDINIKGVYDNNCNIITFLKLEDIEKGEDKSLISLPDTKFAIKCENDKAKVIVSNIPADNKLMITGRLEELGITILNIILLTK